MAEIVENGPWKAGQEQAFVGRETYIESEDFTHDVRLIVDGDFEGPEQCFAYAEEIAKRLNTVSNSRNFDIEQYIRDLPWREDTPDLHKTLIAGNLRTLYNKLFPEAVDTV